MSSLISDLRSQIDAIDDEIVELLAHRLELASKIGVIKAQIQRQILDDAREEEILERLSQKGILRRDQIEMLYRQIFLLTKEIQEEG
ncbi:chorismate mutase [Helicobacter pametensis]|uniref:chorismate mutase n=1 Tax=Helicobacter pametensis TaxID=95149 RepID=UPI0004B24591|nr:chorismate mutase [Helicobacter pametensis]